MLQFVVWTALEAEGLGASLQHHAAYADEIASGIRREFGLSETWKCTGLMPFGVPVGPPGQPGREKTFKLIGERVRVINDASVRSLKPSAPQPPHSPATSAPFLRTVKVRFHLTSDELQSDHLNRPAELTTASPIRLPSPTMRSALSWSLRWPTSLRRSTARPRAR